MVSRYFNARTISPYLVIMPKKALTHIQKTAPGPPTVMAVATPTMLPVPTVLARAVETAWKPLMLVSSAPLALRPITLPMVMRIV